MWKWIKQEAKNLELWLSNKPQLWEENGAKIWYLNGKRHRVDGPAVECGDGYKAWYKNGEPHREDGPAIERPDGVKKWYLNGELIYFACPRDNYIVLERSIPTNGMFGAIKLTAARLLTAYGTILVYDNLPGMEPLD